MKKKIKGTLERPRLTIHKSNLRLITQTINDEKAHTLAYLITTNLEKNQDSSRCRKNKTWAKKLGIAMANELKAKKINQVVYDRNGYRYHGVVKVFFETVKREFSNERK